MRFFDSCTQRVTLADVAEDIAIIPTLVAGETDIDTLPIGEREIIKLLAKQVLRAVSESYRFRETVAVLSCGDNSFTAKGKVVQNVGWKAYSEKEQTDKVLPELADGDELKVVSSEIKEGTTTPLPFHRRFLALRYGNSRRKGNAG